MKNINLKTKFLTTLFIGSMFLLTFTLIMLPVEAEVNQLNGEVIVKDEDGSEYIQGQCIVKFQYEGPFTLNTDAASLSLANDDFKNAFADQSDSIAKKNKKFKLKKVRPLGTPRKGLNAKQANIKEEKLRNKIRKKFNHRTKRIPPSVASKKPVNLTTKYLLEFEDTGKSTAEICQEYADDHEHVIYAHPNYIAKSQALPSNPDDTYYNEFGLDGNGDLWGLNNNGQTVEGYTYVCPPVCPPVVFEDISGTSDADIDAPEAWAIINPTTLEPSYLTMKGNTTTGQPMVVAVVDTGVDYRHEDLVNQMWINPDEDIYPPGGNGIVDGDPVDCNPGFVYLPATHKDFNCVDDDSNCYIDDIVGFDFVNSFDGPGNDGCLDDLEDTIVATPDDNVTIVPEDSNPMDDNRHGTHVAGIIAAEGDNAMGVIGVAPANVRIMALKALRFNISGPISKLGEAIRYAVANGADIINNSWGISGGRQGYPDSLKDEIVAAYNAGVVLVFSAGNKGKEVKADSPAGDPKTISVAASDISDNKASFSNYGTHVDVMAPGDQIWSTMPGVLFPSNKYLPLSGTSMAAPHVSGLAALIMANNPNPNLTPDEVKQVIRTSADDVGLPGITASGRVNAYNALQVSSVDVDVEIVAPIEDSLINSSVGTVMVQGIADGLDFQSFALDYKHTDDIGWTLIPIDAAPDTDPLPPPGGDMAYWDVGSILQGGEYFLKLGVTSTETIVPEGEAVPENLVFDDIIKLGIWVDDPQMYLISNSCPQSQLPSIFSASDTDRTIVWSEFDLGGASCGGTHEQLWKCEFDLNTETCASIGPVTGATGKKSDISGNRVVWHNFTNPFNKVYLYDPVVDGIIDISALTALGLAKEIAISGDYVVFQEDTPVTGPENIYYCTYSAGACTGKTLVGVGEDIDISNDQIVYLDGVNIQLYDITGGGTTAVTTGLTSGNAVSNPAIDGGNIVWQGKEDLDGDTDFSDESFDIFYFDMAAPSIPLRITTDEKDQVNPDISGDIIVWEDHRHQQKSIYYYNLDNQSAGEKRLTTNPGDFERPRIFDTQVVFSVSSATMQDIYLYELSVCGNSAVEPTELCDIGDTISCTISVGSDDYAAIQPCNSSCSGFEACTTCGNGSYEPGFGEECDDGNTDNTDSCINSCLNAACGDSYVQAGVEDCDYGADYHMFLDSFLKGLGDAGYNPDTDLNGDDVTGGPDYSLWLVQFSLGAPGPSGLTCASPPCTVPPGDNDGDGIANALDNCIDIANGPNELPNTKGGPCDPTILPNICFGNQLDTDGDGYGNICDGDFNNDGLVLGDNLNRATCITFGAATGTLACDAGCNFDTTDCNYCGNGIYEPLFGEECDDGNADDLDACNNLCVINFCGDVIVNNGEECDDGQNGVDTDLCTDSCTWTFCPDGITQSPNGRDGILEECDDNNSVETDLCSSGCQLTFCGDGFTQSPNGRDGILEECDDGNADNFDACNNLCVINFCGDGVVNNGEVCEINDIITCTITSGSDDYPGYQDCLNDCSGFGACQEIVCGDAMCHPGEDNTTCPEDCAVCGDGTCDWPTEDNVNCVSDCPFPVMLTLGADNTVYRTGFIDDPYEWIIKFNGWLALQRNASNELQYKYFRTDPGTYTVHVEQSGNIISNVVSYVMPGTVYVCIEPIPTGPEYAQECTGDSLGLTADTSISFVANDNCTSGVGDCEVQCAIGYSPIAGGCALCGDSIVSANEECDDSNTVNNDGCENDCTITCTVDADCDDNIFCNGAETCVSNVCQDNADPCPAAQDACDEASDSCISCPAGTVPAGYYMQPSSSCAPGYFSPDDFCYETPPVCGNNIIEFGEECDDGGTVSNDGCSDTCIVEYCGDNVTQTGIGETCDGNAVSCTTAQGYAGFQNCNSTCTGFDSCSPSESCGDGIRNGPELCDGADLGLEDCTTIGQGFFQGTLGCNGTCDNWDTSLCSTVRPACAHDKCVIDPSPLDANCDPCVQTICELDPYCCNTSWDEICTQEVFAYCFISCDSMCDGGSDCNDGIYCNGPEICTTEICSSFGTDPCSLWGGICVESNQACCGDGFVTGNEQCELGTPGCDTNCLWAT